MKLAVTPASRVVVTICFAIALTMHLGGVLQVDLQPEAEIEGGAGAQEARLGTSFADMAAGVLTSTETMDLAEPVPVNDSATPLDPDLATPPETPEDPAQTLETVDQVTPPPPDATPPVDDASTAEAPPVDVARRADVPEPSQTQQVRELTSATADITPVETLPETSSPTPPEPSVTEALDATVPILQDTVPEPQQTPQVIAALPQMQPQETPTAAPEVLPSTEPETTTLSQSLRPPPRPRQVQERVEPQPRQQAARAPQPRGNNQQNARRGTDTGSETAAADAPSTGQSASRATGNARATNYPGSVARKIRRVPRPRGVGKGRVVVSFRIASNGGLSSVSVARSSGVADLDRAALRIIQRAAPFPAPPPGAQTLYRIPIEGR